MYVCGVIVAVRVVGGSGELVEGMYTEGSMALVRRSGGQADVMSTEGSIWGGAEDDHEVGS